MIIPFFARKKEEVKLDNSRTKNNELYYKSLDDKTKNTIDFHTEYCKKYKPTKKDIEDLMDWQGTFAETKNWMLAYVYFQLSAKIKRLEDLIKSSKKSGKSNKKSKNRNNLVKKK